jgi:hypothetical protein
MHEKGTMRLVKTILRREGRGMKENNGRWRG